MKVDDGQLARIREMRSLLSSLSATAKTEMAVLKRNIESEQESDITFHTFFLVAVITYINSCRESLRLYENKLEKIRNERRQR